MTTHIDDTRARAANPEHPWDRRALDWPGLTTDAIVVEVGGYKGRWALQMAQKYWPRLYVYEPQPWAAEVCRQVLRPYGAFVFEYGLGVRDERLPMARFETDGCTFVAGAGQHGELRDAARVLPNPIDLMLVNIEGYEYVLLPYLLAQGIYPRRLMVQFHDHADPDGSGTARIYEALAGADYHLLWTYGPTLMAWERHAGIH